MWTVLIRYSSILVSTQSQKSVYYWMVFDKSNKLTTDSQGKSFFPIMFLAFAVQKTPLLTELLLEYSNNNFEMEVADSKYTAMPMITNVRLEVLNVPISCEVVKNQNLNSKVLRYRVV